MKRMRPLGVAVREGRGVLVVVGGCGGLWMG